MEVSIVITFYNKGPKLIGAIESVINQLTAEDELIILNDNSDDIDSIKTFSFCKEKYSDVIFIDNSCNFGPAKAKNIGVLSAKKEIVALLDADDEFYPGSVAAIKEGFTKYEDADLLFGNYERWEVNENNVSIIKPNSLASKDCILIKKRLIRNWILLGTSPFKKSFFLKINGFNEFFPRTDDRDFHIKGLMNEGQFVYIDALLYKWYRYPDGNNSGIPLSDTLSSFFRNFRFYYKYSGKLWFFCLFLKKTTQLIWVRLTKSIDGLK